MSHLACVPTCQYWSHPRTGPSNPIGSNVRIEGEFRGNEELRHAVQVALLGRRVRPGAGAVDERPHYGLRLLGGVLVHRPHVQHGQVSEDSRFVGRSTELLKSN